MLHPNEVPLVFRGSTGVPLPNKNYNTMLAEAETLGAKHVDALKFQAAVQAKRLTENA